MRGHGRTGFAAGFYLAAAGIGTLGLVDFDVVDASNLHRQMIHPTKDVGRKKLDSAAEKLLTLNPDVNIVKHDTMLTGECTGDSEGLRHCGGRDGQLSDALPGE